MNMFDSGNVTKRAVRALGNHMDILIGAGKYFEKIDDNYYKYFDEESQDYMKVSYNIVKKFISRTFNMEFTTVMQNVDFDFSFTLKLKYHGFPHISDAYFAGKKDEKYKEVECIFNDEKLMKKLVKLASQVDLAYFKIEYISIAQKLKITICPYAGSYLWVVFPPVFYSLQLKEEEMNVLYEMGTLIRDYVSESLS